ncbi:zinc-binding alcohol dehydrogenase family protein [Streptomyces sp. NPDC005012]|uniref:zinc-binding alcohol dehydrogenase family protein n=1 Tax=unclassified Streptomyces TaxID=2593676 RepID=UPI0033B9A55E
MMQAWVVNEQGRLTDNPLQHTSLARPEVGCGEVLVRVLACGICRTDLHVITGDLPARRPRVIPGHQIVGEVVAVAADVPHRRVGEIVGAGWPRSTCGRCRFCVTGRENLCLHSRFTGWHADGGYAQYALLKAPYCWTIPAGYDPVRAAPLLCAGISGYRAVRMARVAAGMRVALYGFGSSAHITAQVCTLLGARFEVFTRSETARRLAMRLGAKAAYGVDERPGHRFDVALVFAPSGSIVPKALRVVDRGGTVVVAGIHMDAIPPLEYFRELFHERQLSSTTSSTVEDAKEFLTLAAAHPFHVECTTYPFDQVPRALEDLTVSRYAGASVLLPPKPSEPLLLPPDGKSR